MDAGCIGGQFDVDKHAGAGRWIFNAGHGERFYNRSSPDFGAWGEFNFVCGGRRDIQSTGGGLYGGMMAQRNITDRAFRYRANKHAPTTRRQCAFCGQLKGVEVGHVDGHEENDAAENLIWTCRPCNVAAGNTLRNAGMGRLTNQYNGGARANPATKKGATSLGQWLQAVGAITPHQDRGDRGLSSDMDVRAAVQMIRDTPQSRRSKFAAQLAGSKRGRAAARYNQTRKRKNIWPFQDKRLSARGTTPASGGIAKFSKGVKAKAKKAVASAKKERGLRKDSHSGGGRAGICEWRNESKRSP